MTERDPEGQISVEQRDNILLMGIDRPEKCNGFTPKMSGQLRDAYTLLDEDEALNHCNPGPGRLRMLNSKR
jgi:enoyl-CoA hydratase